MALRSLSLCSGIGGLDLALGGIARTVCYVEREAFAAATLVRAMEEGSLDTAPIWSDLRTFDALAWRGAVDLVVAGFPCQPVSCAGLRRAQRDERWLWPSVARCVRDSGSWGVFLENVPGIVNRGMADVLEDLAGLGFSAEWDLLSAEDVGAPHRRVRWWCLAANADRLRVLADEKQPEGHGKADADTRRNGAHGSVADAVVRDGGGIPRRGEAQESAGGPPRERTAAPSACRNGADADGGRQHAIGQPGEVLAGDARGRDVDGLRQAWATEPGMGRVADGVPDRAHRLRALGNAVVPPQARAAFCLLWDRLIVAR